MIRQIILLVSLFSISFAKSLIALKNPVVSLKDDKYQFSIVEEGSNVQSVVLKSFKTPSGKSTTSNQELKKVKSEYIVNIGKEDLAVGICKLQFLVTTKDGSTVTETLQAIINTSVEIVSANILGKAMKYPEQLHKDLKLSYSSKDKFAVTLEIKTVLTQELVEPHQTFLVFTHVETKTQTHFVLKETANKQMKLTLDLSMEGSSFKYLSGTYKVEIFIGDIGFEKSIHWDLGQIKITLPPLPLPSPSPLYSKTLLHTSDTTLKALPEIAHVMRKPDVRPPAIVSIIFTIAVLIPLFGFLAFFSRSDLKLQFPQGCERFYAAGFLCSLASILVLFVVYWVKLSMFCTLGYLAPLSASAFFFGHAALNKSASSCSNKEKEE